MFSARLPSLEGFRAILDSPQREKRLYLLLLLAEHRALLFRQLEKSLRRINQGGPPRPCGRERAMYMYTCARTNAVGPVRVPRPTCLSFGWRDLPRPYDAWRPLRGCLPFGTAATVQKITAPRDPSGALIFRERRTSLWKPEEEARRPAW